jgi:MoxR-like ATPase
MTATRGAPKARPLSTIERVSSDRVEVTTLDGNKFSIRYSQIAGGYPSGSSFDLYPTELAQIGTRLARHFGLDWQVKFTNADGESVFRTTADRISFIYCTMEAHTYITQKVDVSDDGAWRGNTRTTTTTTSTASQTTTEKGTTAMATGSLEQIIGDMIDARIKTSDAPLNEDAVRTIVQDAIANRPADKLEIKFSDHTTVMDKHTHPQFPNVLKVMMLARQSTKWPYLVGPAGTGKSTMGEHLAEALDVPFAAFPANPGAMMHDILGFVSPTTHEYCEPVYVTMMRNGGLVLLDELDKLHPGIAAGTNGLLAQMRVTLPTGESFPLHDKFFIVAGANTYGTGATSEYVGSTQLDAATLDRFARIPINYDTEYEKARACAVLGATNGAKWMAQITKMRDNRDSHKIQAIISTRSVIGVATMVAGGIAPDNALDWCLFANLNRDQRQRLMADTDFRCLEVSK